MCRVDHHIVVRSFSTTCRRRWTGTPSGRPTTMLGPTLPTPNGESIEDRYIEGRFRDSFTLPLLSPKSRDPLMPGFGSGHVTCAK